MKLKKFTKNKKQKRIVMGSIVGILLLIGGITLYRTFAMYKVEKSFDVLNGIVPPFMNGDIQLAVTVDGKKEETIPTKNDKNYGVVVACDHATGSWDKNNWRAIIEDFTGSKVKCNLYFESTLSGYIKALSKVEESIIEEEHEATEQTPELTDYRYVGANPNNYVCLEESDSCTDDNLYRIIGVIPTQKEEDANSQYEDRVKLIKNTNIGEYLWSGSQDNESNDWEQSTLNTKILNEEYWTKIESYHEYIDKAKWYLGEYDNSGYVADNLYKHERSSTTYNKNSISTYQNVGIIYASDFGFATSGGIDVDRNTCLTYSMGTDQEWVQTPDCVNNNWLKKEEDMHILLKSSELNGAKVLKREGYITGTTVTKFSVPVYPSFYLKTNVLFQNGNGTQGNPYRVSINEN